jgi:hypothetical protein
MIATDCRPRVLSLLASLDPALAELGISLVPLAVTVSRVRRVLGLPMPVELSAPARAVAIVEAGGERAVEEALAGLDQRQRKGFLRYASSFVDTPLASDVADATATYGVDPSPRLAAVLSISDPSRCIALLKRLQDANDLTELVPALSAAHLARIDRGLPVPEEIAATWAKFAAEPPPFPGAPEIYEARLKLEARHDPMAALAKLPEIVLEVGAPELDSGIAAVVSRVVTLDRAAAWALTRDLRWAHGRALALEGIARVEPRAAEIEPGIRGLLDEWRNPGQNIDKSPSGAFKLANPLLATCAHARRPDLALAVIELLGPSPFEIRAATSHETRRANMVDGAWTPEYWDMWTATSHDGAAAELPAAAALPDIESAALGAWWKLGTLPLHELPRARPEGDGLP